MAFRSFILGSSALVGFSSAGIHRSWTRWEDELFNDHQEGANPKTDQLGGTGRTFYNYSGTTNEKSVVRPALSVNLAPHLPSSSDEHALATKKNSSSSSTSATFDAVVIGGGFAGLHTALALAEKGKKVVILEGKRIGNGASGRNGGSGITGFHISVDDLALWMGSKEKAIQLWQQGHAGYERLKQLIAKYRIQCDANECGGYTLNFTKDKDYQNYSTEDLLEDIDTFNKKYGQCIEFRSKAELEKNGVHFCGDDQRYSHGYWDPRNLQLNPLELCFGLARACETNGVQIYENSKVLDIKRDIRGNFIASTATGAVRAKHCVLCTNHAPWNLSKSLSLRATPIATSMMLTAPIDKTKLDKCLSASAKTPSIFDTRFGLAYFRRVPGDRILYGCFASGMPYFHDRGGKDEHGLKTMLCDDLHKSFSKFVSRDDIRADRVWSGRLSCQYPIFPLVGKDASSGMYHSLAYAGHGIVPTCAASIVLANAICDGDTQYELWDEVIPKWMRLQGGPTGYLGATAACTMLRYYDQSRGRF